MSLPISQHVLDRLLLAKYLLRYRGEEEASSADPHLIAAQVIAAHDSSELALAALVEHGQGTVKGDKQFLLNYADSLVEKNFSVPRDFFKRLNGVRNDVKHLGVVPHPAGFSNIIQSTYKHISDMCIAVLGTSLDDLDESTLIKDAGVRRHFLSAKTAVASADYRGALSELALGLHRAFKSNPSVRSVNVGDIDPSSAIRLSGLGVRLNDYLALQSFLPRMSWNSTSNEQRWKPSRYHHPGNWNERNLRFCLGAFLHVILRIQDSDYVPVPLERSLFFRDTLRLRAPAQLYKGGTVYRTAFDRMPLRYWQLEPFRVANTGEEFSGQVSILDEREIENAPKSGSFFLVDRTMDWNAAVTQPMTIFLSASEEVEISCRLRDEKYQRLFAQVEFPWEPDGY